MAEHLVEVANRAGLIVVDQRAGLFSLAEWFPDAGLVLVAVGVRPEELEGFAAWWRDGVRPRSLRG